MTYYFKSLTTTLLALLCGLQAQAQGLSLLPSNRIENLPAQTSADFIVAIVNSEPVTNNEVQREMGRILQQMAQQRRAAPDLRALATEVLDRLINTRVQIHLARDSGIQVDEAAIDQAEQSIALQNQVEVVELRRRIEREGLSQSQFRTQLREQLLVQRLRERDVESRVRVSEQDIDGYLHEQENSQDLSQLQLNLSQILVPVPETASAVQVEALHARARRALERARAGQDFVALVHEFSEVSDQANGGQLGLRSADRYPQLFVDATRHLAVGDIAALVRSPAGFHILKVVEKINAALPTMAVNQNHARHILLRPNAKLSETDARVMLADFKRRIVTGRADFAVLARDNSQDGSAAQGGDLGWASPGMFVPEFEEVMNRLIPGEISDPLVSRFGVHLIQLLERRKATLSTSEQRDMVRALLRDKKLEESYRTWEQDQRGRAYVELREPPQ